MKKIIFLLLLIVLLQDLYAQVKKSTWKFTSMNAMGILYGENGSSFTMSSVNGVRKKNLAVGIGINYDQYLYTTLPVYAEVRKHFGNKSWKPFVYADLGASIPLKNSSLPSKWANGTEAYDLEIGLFTELGMGFEKMITTTTAFYMQTGYTEKQFAYYSSSNFVNPLFNQTPTTNRYDYYYRRIAFKMGIRF